MKLRHLQLTKYTSLRGAFSLKSAVLICFIASLGTTDLSGQLAVHTNITGSGTGTITGDLNDGGTTADFEITNGASTGYDNSNNPTSATVSNGSGAGFEGITLQYSNGQTCTTNPSPCVMDDLGADSGGDVIQATYTVTNVQAGFTPRIRISQKLDGTNGNDEASTWTFSWTGGGTADWYDPASGATLYRFIADGTNPTNSELASNSSRIEAGWNNTYGEIVGATTSGTLVSGGSLNMYATNNDETQWYVELPAGVTSVTVTKVTNTASTGPYSGIGQRYPALGYGDEGSNNVQPNCSSTYDASCIDVTRIFQDGATYNEWISFGADLVATGAITGNVSADSNNDGTFDQDLENVSITLYRTDGTEITTVLTNSDGNYEFINVPPGDYYVVQTQPVNYTSVSDSDGGTENVIGQGGTSGPIVVTSGVVNSGNDFMEVLTVALPVSYLSFNASHEGNSIQLHWSTAHEVNNDRFDIESSVDGENFIKVGEVLGNGNTSEVSIYNYVDRTKGYRAQGRYYRLKQVDYNGDYDYSNTIYVSFENAIEELNVYPNPASTMLQIDIKKDAIMRIYNLTGRVLKEQYLISGHNSLDISDLNKGMYLIKVGDRHVERFIKR